jgi:hypothetical protein
MSQVGLTARLLLSRAQQSRGEGIGNGRAAAILFAREGAKVALARCDERMGRGDQGYDRCRGRHIDGGRWGDARDRTPSNRSAY